MSETRISMTMSGVTIVEDVGGAMASLCGTCQEERRAAPGNRGAQNHAPRKPGAPRPAGF